MFNGTSQKSTVNKHSIYILGGAIGVLTIIVTMLMFAAVILIFNIDRNYAVPFATISLAVGCFVAGRIIAKKIGDKGYLVGAIVGSVVFVVITILSLILGNKLSLNTLFHFVIVMLASISGGIVGVNSNRHKKYI